MQNRSRALPWLSAVLLATGSFSVGRHLQTGTRWEHQIFTDIDQNEVTSMSKEGWAFVGYLGESIRGAGSDETLWRRPAE